MVQAFSATTTREAEEAGVANPFEAMFRYSAEAIQERQTQVAERGATTAERNAGTSAAAVANSIAATKLEERRLELAEKEYDRKILDIEKVDPMAAVELATAIQNLENRVLTGEISEVQRDMLKAQYLAFTTGAQDSDEDVYARITIMQETLVGLEKIAAKATEGMNDRQKATYMSQNLKAYDPLLQSFDDLILATYGLEPGSVQLSNWVLFWDNILGRRRAGATALAGIGDVSTGDDWYAANVEGQE